MQTVDGPRVLTRPCFNEAAGFTQRKHGVVAITPRTESAHASMRPPVLPSGNDPENGTLTYLWTRFNEAAGFTQRKRPIASEKKAQASRLQ